VDLPKARTYCILFPMMETVVSLKKSLYDETGTAAANMGISRERFVSLAVEDLLARCRNDAKGQSREFEPIQNASMSDIWELIKNDSW